MAKSTEGKVTPLMAQYFSVKKKHPDAILLFRVGDFYETFGSDAVLVSKILGIVLTSRNNGGSDVELAGFPFHSVDTYMPKLVKAGYRVAVCEQLEKPSKEKKIVDRGVTEIVTPGLAMDDKLLNQKSNNWLCAIHIENDREVGIAFLDISTGEFLVDQGSFPYCEKMLNGFNPVELLITSGQLKKNPSLEKSGRSIYKIEDWVFTLEYAREKLLEHFSTVSMKGYGIDDMLNAQKAAGALIHYLFLTENKFNGHINKIQKIDHEKIVWLDRFTVRNLEIIQSSSDGGLSLVDVMDKTLTPMGGRLMKKWALMPLKDPDILNRRLSVVEFLVGDEELRKNISDILKTIGDIERLSAKIPSGRINPREFRQLARSITSIGNLKNILKDSPNPTLASYSDNLNPLTELKDKIEQTIIDEPPVNLNKGNIIQNGCHQELDELKYLIENSQKALLDIQQREAEATGISGLKIGFNNVFGYYLEVTNKYKEKDLIPENWVRKQTLTNAERYISDELKQLETKILTAEEKISAIEAEIYEELRLFTLPFIPKIQQNCKLLSECDCLLSFAVIAVKNEYCKPIIDMSYDIDIKAGRHPVIEQLLPLGESYIPNDVFLSKDTQQIMMITGPNMSGKSAVLRQTALICLMAQMGSFVPATAARLGIIDKVFTRVGASDNITSGESTFMVEMNETSSILNNISDRSLVLLDEIGRGTSTYDGISIAWSIAEFLHENPAAHPKTLFATHYHELNELAESFERIKNFHVATKEIGTRIIFLRKLTEGGSEHSFGIHVARMAGMPKTIVQRADEILKEMESKSIGENKKNVKKKPLKITPAMQMSIFQTNDPKAELIRKELESLELQSMTPIDCMMKLFEWKKLLS